MDSERNSQDRAGGTMSRYDMPADRTWCGRFRCCREANHPDGCEEDITYLTHDELDAIRTSGDNQ